ATPPPSAAMFGRTSRILPSSISTSACAKSPTRGSSVSTTPPLSRIRRSPCTRASSGSASAFPVTAPSASAFPVGNIGAAAVAAATAIPDFSNCRREGPPAGVSSPVHAPAVAGGVGCDSLHMGISMLKDGAQSRFYRAVGWAKSLALPVRVGNRAQAIFAHAESAEHARLPTLQLRGRFANSESEVLLQRLNAHDPTLVVHVPHGY